MGKTKTQIKVYTKMNNGKEKSAVGAGTPATETENFYTNSISENRKECKR